MDREKILQRHAYNEERDLEKKMWLDLQRHESLQKSIQSHCEKGMDKQDRQKILQRHAYNEDIYKERNREKKMNQLSEKTMDKQECEDRQKIIQRHAYNEDIYKERDLEKKQYETTSQFEQIQSIDQERQTICDDLLLDLQRHESLQKTIQSHCEETMNQLSEEGTDKQECEQIMGYYHEAFLVERERCILVFGLKSRNLSESVGELCQSLTILRNQNYHDNKSIARHFELLKIMGRKCEFWRSVLFEENFDVHVKKPIFVYVPEKTYQEREIKYKEKLHEACTIMERKHILETYAYDEKRYDKEDLSKQTQKKTMEFEIIQDIHKQRQIITEDFLRKLSRHKSVLENIKRIYENTLCRLQEQGKDKHHLENIWSWYHDAFLIEKDRFIPIFESTLTTLSISVYKFKTTLKKLKILDTKLKFLQSSQKRQLKLCEKLEKTCMKWKYLLLQEDFNGSIERLDFSYSPDE